MDYYLGIFKHDLPKEKYGDIVGTIEQFSGFVEQADRDIIVGRTDDIKMLSCLIQMKESYPDIQVGFSRYVGIAKGLAKIAKSGEILISEEIEQKIIEDFELASLGMLSIEGMSSQILVYRIEEPVKELQFPKSKPRVHPILRTNEIRSLEDLLRVSNAVLVTGPTGGGKTIFLDQLVEQWSDREILRTTCSSYIMGFTLQPIIDIVTQILGVHGIQGLEEKQTAIEKRLKELEIADIGTSYLVILDFLGLGEEESILEKLELKTRVDLIISTVAELIKRISWGASVVMIIEDAEYMDVSSVNFVQHLMEKLLEENVCFIFSSAISKINVVGLKVFELRNIEKKELVKLIKNTIGEEITLPPTTPFHVAQYLSLYKEEMMSYFYNQYRGETSITSFGLSFYDIKTIIKRRLELLGDKKEFLFDLVVAGFKIHPDELPIEENNHYLFDYFVKQGYFKRYFNYYMFINPLLQNELYNFVPDKEKRHQRLANYYSRIEGYEEYAAFHYREAGVIKKAIEFLMKAGDRAVKNGAYESGINYYHQILECCRRQGESVDLELLVSVNEGLADIYRGLGDEKNALKYYKIVLDSYKEILKE